MPSPNCSTCLGYCLPSNTNSGFFRHQINSNSIGGVSAQLVTVNRRNTIPNNDGNKAQNAPQTATQNFNDNGIGLGPIDYSNTIEANPGLESKQFYMDNAELKKIEGEALRLSRARDAEARDAKSGEITSTTQSTSLVFKHQDPLSDNSEQSKPSETPSKVLEFPIKAPTVLEMVYQFEHLSKKPSSQVGKTEAVR